MIFFSHARTAHATLLEDGGRLGLALAPVSDLAPGL